MTVFSHDGGRFDWSSRQIGSNCSILLVATKRGSLAKAFNKEFTLLDP